MDTSLEFHNLLDTHLKIVRTDMNKVVLDMIEKSQRHDIDKLFDPIVYKLYSKHYAKLKQIPFGTEEYRAYNKKYLGEPHLIHGQSAHHFYSRVNTTVTKPTLMDLLEAVIDINASNKQYGSLNDEEIFEIIKMHNVFENDIETFVKNTIAFLNKGEENER